MAINIDDIVCHIKCHYYKVLSILIYYNKIEYLLLDHVKFILYLLTFVNKNK